MSKRLKITFTMEQPKKYIIDVLGLFFIGFAVLITSFETLSSSDLTAIKFLIMALIGFSFTISLLCRIDVSLSQAMSGLIGIGFGAGLVVLLAMLPQVVMPARVSSTQLILLAPVAEELFFRGFILGIFILIALKINFIELAYIANVPVSAIFAWFHANVYNVELTQVFAPLFIGGLMFGFAFLLTKNLSSSLWAHLFVNALSLGLLRFVL